MAGKIASNPGHAGRDPGAANARILACARDAKFDLGGTAGARPVLTTYLLDTLFAGQKGFKTMTAPRRAGIAPSADPSRNPRPAFSQHLARRWARDSPLSRAGCTLGSHGARSLARRARHATSAGRVHPCLGHFLRYILGCRNASKAGGELADGRAPASHSMTIDRAIIPEKTRQSRSTRPAVQPRTLSDEPVSSAPPGREIRQGGNKALPRSPRPSGTKTRKPDRKN